MHYLDQLFQVFSYSKRGELRRDFACLDANTQSDAVELHRCHELKGNQYWWHEKVDIIRKCGGLQMFLIIASQDKTTIYW